jgi:hypothetical protein
LRDVRFDAWLDGRSDQRAGEPCQPQPEHDGARWHRRKNAMPGPVRDRGLRVSVERGRNYGDAGQPGPGAVGDIDQNHTRTALRGSTRRAQDDQRTGDAERPDWRGQHDLDTNPAALGLAHSLFLAEDKPGSILRSLRSHVHGAWPTRRNRRLRQSVGRE